MSRPVLEFLTVSEFEQEILLPVISEPPTFVVKRKEKRGEESSTAED